MRKSDASREDRIAALVAQFVEGLSRGEVPDADEVCRREPELAEEIRPLLVTALALHDASPKHRMEPKRRRALETRLRLAARAMAAVSKTEEEGPFRDPFEILLALLYVKGKWSRPGDAIEGALRMMKAVFLLSLETRLRRLKGYRFRAYRFGPFADKVYEDLERLRRSRLVEISGPWREKDPAARKASPIKFRLTAEGLERAKAVVERVRKDDPDLLDEMRRVKSKLSWATRDEFLRYVYARYPEMTTKSEIAKEISGLEAYARRHTEEGLWE